MRSPRRHPALVDSWFELLPTSQRGGPELMRAGKHRVWPFKLTEPVDEAGVRRLAAVVFCSAWVVSAEAQA